MCEHPECDVREASYVIRIGIAGEYYVRVCWNHIGDGITQARDVGYDHVQAWVYARVR